MRDFAIRNFNDRVIRDNNKKRFADFCEWKSNSRISANSRENHMHVNLTVSEFGTGNDGDRAKLQLNSGPTGVTVIVPDLPGGCQLEE